MFILAVNEFLRNIRKNILVILQMILVYAMAIFIISAFVEQLTLYRGVSDYLDDTGLMLASTAVISTDVRATEEDLKENLTKIEWIQFTSIAFFYEQESSLLPKPDFLQLELVTTNPQKAPYHPPLLSGKWCESGTGEDGVIRVVVSDNFPFEVAAGQEFTFDGKTFLVTGIFSSEELMYSANNFFDALSYLSYYDSVNGTGDGSSLETPFYCMLASYEDATRELSGELWPGGGPLTIDFEDDITEEELEENLEILQERYGYTKNLDVFYTKEIKDYSNQLLQIKLIPMGVVFAIVLLLAITCLLTSGAVCVLYEKRNYAIYFITGNNWKQTFYLSMIHWGIIAGTSLILAVCGCLLVRSVGLLDSFAFNFTVFHVIVIGIITIIMLFLALLLPYRMLRNMQPVSILRDNDK